MQPGSGAASLTAVKGQSMTVIEEQATKSGLLRAMTVINLLADRAPQTLGVTAVARELELPKAVAHRILKEFVAGRFLSFDDLSKQYSLGPRALTMGLAALRTLDVPATARPYMEQLVEATGETTTLSMRQGLTRLYIDQVVSPREVRMTVSLGTQHALHAGSSSKSILAAMSQEDIDEYLMRTDLAQMTSAAITSKALLLEDLQLIRRRGYAVSMGERQVAAGSVAAAIHDASGNVWGSISLCGPRDRFGADVCEKLGELVADAAEAISRDVGYRQQG